MDLSIYIFCVVSFALSYICIICLIASKLDNVSKLDKDSIEYKISKLSKKELRIELKNKIDLTEYLEEKINVLEDINLSLIHENLNIKGDK